jgi:hypothetical protein
MTPSSHALTIRRWILEGQMVFVFKNQITKLSSQWEGLVIGRFFIKLRDTAVNPLNGSANTGDKAEGLTAVHDLQNPPVTDLHMQGT